MLTLAYAYYENPGMLARHVEAWRRYDEATKAAIRFLVVDDGSPTSPAKSVLMASASGAPSVALYRIREDIPWNWDGARNLAMHVAETEWVWLLDSDRLVDPEQAAAAVALKKQSGVWYRPNQRLTDGTILGRPHPNCYIVSRTDFWRTGGHDEDFRGFWDKDKTFRQRLAHVATPVFVPGVYMTGYQRTDVADCDTRMGRRHTQYHSAVMPPALLAKGNGPFYVAQNPLRFSWERQL